MAEAILWDVRMGADNRFAQAHDEPLTRALLRSLPPEAQEGSDQAYWICRLKEREQSQPDPDEEVQIVYLYWSASTRRRYVGTPELVAAVMDQLATE